MLKHFKVDKKRTKLVVPVKFYQMNLQGALEKARKIDPSIFVGGTDHLPSWSKFAKDPIKAKGFWTRMLEAVFLGQANLPELNVELQTQEVSDSGFKVVMMFLPGSLTNDNLKTVVSYTKQTLKGYHVLEISGAGTHNGKKISNKNAEKITNEVIETCKKTDTPLIILSRGMAQRSYSIGEITELYLCYDEGEAGATTQKISRCLTPSIEGKNGHIFSLSFDPNRDDKFDAMMLATAQNYAKRKGVDIDKALTKVIKTIDIFECTEDGSVSIDPDTYLNQLLERNSVTRITGKQADLSVMTIDEIIALANGNSEYSRLTKTDVAEKGKTGLNNKKVSSRDKMSKEDLKLVDKARKTLTTIVEHLPYVVIMTAKDSIKDALTVCCHEEDYNVYINQEFGVSAAAILGFFERGILNYDLATLHTKAAKKHLTN
jgi:hypothetical protein